MTANGGALCVGPGIALDGQGREIVVPRTHTESADDLRHRCGDTTGEVHHFEVLLAFAECPWEPVKVPGLCHGRRPHEEHNRIRDWYAVRLVDPEEDAGDEHDPSGDSVCPLSRKDLSVHDYLCQALKQCDDHDHHHHDHGIALAEIEVEVDDQGGVRVEVVDDCRLRRFVPTNRLVYDLVNCYHGDLPHVRSTSWEHGKKRPYWRLPAALRIDFDQPIDPDTLDPSTVQVSYTVLESETGSRSIRLIPVEIQPNLGDSTSDGATSLTLTIDGEWYADEIGSEDHPSSPRRSQIANTLQIGGEVIVQVRLVGSHITGGPEHKALDGDYIGGRFPSGNGTQGGDFVSHLWLTNTDDSEAADMTATAHSTQEEVTR